MTAGFVIVPVTVKLFVTATPEKVVIAVAVLYVMFEVAAAALVLLKMI